MVLQKLAIIQIKNEHPPLPQVILKMNSKWVMVRTATRNIIKFILRKYRIKSWRP